MRSSGLLIGCLVGAFVASTSTGCVISTHEGIGSTPSVPLAPVSEGPAKPSGPSQIVGSHILVAYKGAQRAAPYVERTRDQARELAEQLRQRALGGEDFAKLAAEFSDDRGSAANGGQLGTFRREQMVGEFSNAAFALEPWQISHVVESSYGFHVILRTE
ncbi:MAG TPA: peptidylprolyl isomerase [Polyangiaceae bacterium]|nr:peptidylprolyl isomerase [Polyangiaceae bacterium]